MTYVGQAVAGLTNAKLVAGRGMFLEEAEMRIPLAVTVNGSVERLEVDTRQNLVGLLLEIRHPIAGLCRCTATSSSWPRFSRPPV